MNCPRCTLLLGLIAVAMLPSQSRLDTTSGCAAGRHAVRVDGMQLHYTRNVSQADAERVAVWLATEKTHREYPGEMTLDRTKAGWRLYLTDPESATPSNDFARWARRLATMLSEGILYGEPVQIRLRTSTGSTMSVTAPIPEVPFFYN